MAAFLDVCRFTPTLGGTTDWTFSTVVTGYQTPTAAGAQNGRLYKYRAESLDLSQWEIGEGAYNSSTGVFARTTVLFNSAGTTAKISFTAAPQVAIVALKEDLISVEEANAFTAAQQAQARTNIGAQSIYSKNYIINGAMMVSQENGSTAGTTNDYYPVDTFRGLISNTTGAYSIAQVASRTPNGSPNRIRVTCTTADAAVAAADNVCFGTALEGLRCADLGFGAASPKTITIQFGCKGPAGTYCVSVRNGASNRSYVAEYTIAAGEANTDVVKSVTIPGDTTGTWATDTSVGLYVYWALMMGTTNQGSAGAWLAATALASSNQFNFMGTLSNVFELFDVGLYQGSVAPAFQVPDFLSELSLCQRYWEKSHKYADAVNIAVAYYEEAYLTVGIGNYQGSTRTFSAVKRIAPTMTYYSPTTGASGMCRAVTAVADKSISTDSVGEKSYSPYISGATASDLFRWNFTANARL